MCQAMEMILTSTSVDGEELRRLGVVSQTMPEERVLAGAMACARKIASQSAPVVALAKQAILIGKPIASDTQSDSLTYPFKYFHLFSFICRPSFLCFGSSRSPRLHLRLFSFIFPSSFCCFGSSRSPGLHLLMCPQRSKPTWTQV